VGESTPPSPSHSDELNRAKEKLDEMTKERRSREAEAEATRENAIRSEQEEIEKEVDNLSVVPILRKTQR
jgi:hypothetical protein